ncbi:MAG TPA: TRAP transporter permease [Clostridia bacterium]|nr:TRAP transporter permease [Clostridia bacterium]
MAKKENVNVPEEIDIASLDSDLAVMKAVEEGSANPFIKAASVVAVLMSMFHLYTAQFGLLDAIGQRGTHMCFAITILLLTMPLAEHNIFTKSLKENKAYRAVCRSIDLVLIVLVWFATYMCRVESLAQNENMGIVTIWASISGGILYVIVIEASRRSLGWILPGLAMLFTAYALAGPYLPLVIAHRGYSFKRIFEFLAVAGDGLFGQCLTVSATVIFMFVMFGAFLEASGCSGFINDIAISLTGRIKSGPALSAVIASALMGTINGSAVANVVGTGTFTIPLMKSRGYKPEFAGGVEAVASTGGQILPPVMGSGAFLMVAFTAESYMTIVKCATLPAICYFVGCAFSVIAQAEIGGIEPTPEDEIPVTRKVLKEGWIYLLIIAILVYCLLGAQLSPARAALFAIYSVPIVMLLDKKKRFTFKEVIPSLKKSGFNSMSIVLGCACAGIVVSMVSLTGIGVVFGDMMIKASGGILFMSLVFTALACIVLGMGLPTTAAYVIAASILAPALIKLGLAMLTAHLFVFYFACLSAITPPVALAAYAGAGIAKCSPMTTAVEACKVGFAGFIVPFGFCYAPAFMMQGSTIEILYVFGTALLGVCAMSMGFQGWYFKRLNPIERIVLLGGGLGLIHPGTLSNIIGVAIMVVMYLYARVYKKKVIA